MRSFLLGLSLSAAFIVGCVVRPLVIPPALADPAVKRWDYYCFDELTSAEVQGRAKQAGREGWELVAAGAVGTLGFRPVWCFKRPLSATTTPPQG